MKGIEKEAEEVAVRRQVKVEGVPLRAAVAKLRDKWATGEQFAQGSPAKEVRTPPQNAVSKDECVQRHARESSKAPDSEMVKTGNHVGPSATAYLNRTYATSSRLNGSHPRGLSECSSVLIGSLGAASSSGPEDLLEESSVLSPDHERLRKLFMEHTRVFTACCGEQDQRLVARNPERC